MSLPNDEASSENSIELVSDERFERTDRDMPNLTISNFSPSKKDLLPGSNRSSQQSFNVNSSQGMLGPSKMQLHYPHDTVDEVESQTSQSYSDYNN